MIGAPVVRDFIVLESRGGDLSIGLEKLGFVPLFVGFVDLAALAPANQRRVRLDRESISADMR